MAISLVVGLVVLVIVVFILVSIGLGASGRHRKAEGGEDMIKIVYTYLVLFATLMMTIGGSVAAFMAVADIVSPNAYYQSYEEYKNMNKVQYTNPTLSETQLRQNYDATVSSERQRTRERAVNSIIKSLGWIVIPFPVFMYFQRQIKLQRATQ